MQVNLVCLAVAFAVFVWAMRRLRVARNGDRRGTG
jgi:hypothetical protein